MKKGGDKMAKKREEISIRSSAAEYLTYVATVGDQQDSIEMRYEDENIWLTQKMMATLYGVGLPTINGHIKKIYAEAGKKYQADIVKTFVSIMGVYPVGTAVTLNNGAIGIVCEVNKFDYGKPKILMLSKDNPDKIELVNLKTHPTIKIVKEINNAELNINPFEIFNNFLQDRISHQVTKYSLQTAEM